MDERDSRGWIYSEWCDYWGLQEQDALRNLLEVNSGTLGKMLEMLENFSNIRWATRGELASQFVAVGVAVRRSWRRSGRRAIGLRRLGDVAA